jgi:hypothetical protein
MEVQIDALQDMERLSRLSQEGLLDTSEDQERATCALSAKPPGYG